MNNKITVGLLILAAFTIIIVSTKYMYVGIWLMANNNIIVIVNWFYKVVGINKNPQPNCGQYT